jgi:hypothetical protein
MDDLPLLAALEERSVVAEKKYAPGSNLPYWVAFWSDAPDDYALGRDEREAIKFLKEMGDRVVLFKFG